MSLASIATYALIGLGIVKAGAVVWLGPQVGVPAWIVAVTAATWVTGPPTLAWLVRQRRGQAARATAA